MITCKFSTAPIGHIHLLPNAESLVGDLNVCGRRYESMEISLAFLGTEYWKGINASMFRQICTALQGKALRTWNGELLKIDVAPIGEGLLDLGTSEQNLLKAMLLTYAWGEPELTTGGISNPDFLNDILITDNTGSSGRQPFIYYIPDEGIKASKQSLNRLCSLGLLSHLELRSDNQVIERFFKPLVLPAVSDHNFGKDANERFQVRNIWSMIIARMQKRISLMIDG